MAQKTKRLTQEHVDRLLKVALPGLLQRIRETEPAAVADLIRLVEVQRRIAPATLAPRKVVWQDWN